MVDSPAVVPEPSEPAGADQLSPDEAKTYEDAQRLSRTWGERLDDFELPCPLCQGTLQFQGVHPDRLYEFAEGEPGVINPLDVLPISFVCNRCGYLAEFDTELFNPAYLARLHGASSDRVEELAVREYRILVPLKGDEKTDTLLNLATAISGEQHGEVIIVDVTQSEINHERLREKLDHYEPRIGDPAPVQLVRRPSDNLADALIEVSEQYHCALLMMDARGWAEGKPSKLTGVIDALVDESICDIATVFDRGLHAVHRILLPTYGGAQARRIAPLALQLARAFDAELHCLYVASTGDKDPEKTGRRVMKDTFSEVIVGEDIRLGNRVVVASNPIQTIVREAANYNLLLLGASARNWRGKTRLSSTSAKIARNADPTSIVLRMRPNRLAAWLRRVLD
jgi:nucleotide-binding universal stress UspA family protein